MGRLFFAPLPHKKKKLLSPLSGRTHSSLIPIETLKRALSPAGRSDEQANCLKHAADFVDIATFFVAIPESLVRELQSRCHSQKKQASPIS